MATRGFGKCVYRADDGTSFSLLVDADYIAEASRGWVRTTPPAPKFAPRGFFPRKVRGLDETGKTQFARVASTDAPLWTGAATTFVVNATDEAPHTCTVIARHQEKYLNR